MGWTQLPLFKYGLWEGQDGSEPPSRRRAREGPEMNIKTSGPTWQRVCYGCAGSTPDSLSATASSQPHGLHVATRERRGAHTDLLKPQLRTFSGRIRMYSP